MQYVRKDTNVQSLVFTKPWIIGEGDVLKFTSPERNFKVPVLSYTAGVSFVRVVFALTEEQVGYFSSSTTFKVRFGSSCDYVACIEPKPETIQYDSEVVNYREGYVINATAENGSIVATLNGVVTPLPIAAFTGDIVGLTVTPIDHYHFTAWSDGSSANPRTIVVSGNKNISTTCVIDEYVVSVVSTHGSVSGAGTYEYGQTCTLEFTPEEHYHFVQWSDGSVENPRSFVVTSNVNLSVNGVPNEYVVSVTATHGSVTGAGTYPYGSTCTLTFIPETGYRFVEWSDGNRENPRSFVVSEDVNLSVEGILGQYVVSADATHGSVTGTGVYNYGDVCTLEFVPEEHYHFVEWGDGVQDNPRSFEVTGDVHHTVVGLIDRFTITGTATNGTVTGYGTYDWGALCTLEFIPDAHYHFTQWSDGGNTNPRTFNVTENKVIDVIGVVDTFTVSAIAHNGTVTGTGTYAYGTVVTLTYVPNEHYHFDHWVDGDYPNPREITVTHDVSYEVYGAIDTFVISVAAYNGSATGAGVYEYGQTCTLTFTPIAHHHFARWSDDNTENPRVFVVTEDKSLSVRGILDRHAVTFSCTNGSVGATVDGIGIQSGDEVDYGKTVIFTITPNEHYHYTGENPEIVVVDGVIARNYVCVIDTYVVSVTAMNGTATGAGIYEYGQTCTLEFIPLEHYHFVQWSDGNTENPRSFEVTGNVELSVAGVIDQYVVSGTATNGVVVGYGTYEYGQTCTLEFTPNQHYHFVEWSDHNTENPRSFVVTESKVIDVEGIGDTKVITVNATHGSVTGAGEYPYGSTCTLTFTPEEHYHFVQWSDGSVENPRSFVVVDDLTLGVDGAKDEFYISAAAVHGSVTGTGTYYYGDTCTLTFIPVEHYHFVEWEDGNPNNPRVFTVTESAIFSVTGVIDQFVVSVEATHGSVSGAGTYDYGSTCTLEFTPDEHYHFVEWSDHSVENPRSFEVTEAVSLSVDGAIDRHVISGTATHGSVVGYGTYDYGAECTLTFIPESGYTFVQWSDGSIDNPRTFTVTEDKVIDVEGVVAQIVISGTATHGSVTGYGSYNYGATCTLTFTPEEHYHFVQWSDGNTENPRSFIATEDRVINVAGSIDQYIVTAVPTHGTVTGAGVYNYGAACTLVFVPEEHYHFDHWSDGSEANPYMFVVRNNVDLTVDGVLDTYDVYVSAEHGTPHGAGVYPYGTEIEVSVTPDEGYYFTYWDDLDNHNPRTVVVDTYKSFYTECVSELVYYTVTASATHGTVVGAGSYVVGSTCTLTVTPDSGYEFDQWNDGNTNNPRSFTVTGNVNLVATCSEIVPLRFTSSGVSTVKMNQVGIWSGTWPIETSYDRVTWSPYTLSTAMTILDGQSIYFRGQKDSTAQSMEDDVFRQFVMTGSVAASGDVTALLNGIGGVSDLTPYGDDTLLRLFRNCDVLTSAPSLPSTTLTSDCYLEMFHGCSSLVNAPTLPATSLVDYCYNSMFKSCSNLVNAPALPATSLAEGCYSFMFWDCTSLVNAPALPATTLPNFCYSRMFHGCTSIIDAPELPATMCTQNCYRGMFYGCTSLVTAPALPATTTHYACYYEMFYGCTSLVHAPALPATSLLNSCYGRMFYGCTSLIDAPVLVAETLNAGCYNAMFSGCTSLTKAPDLIAVNLSNDCYKEMFKGCVKLEGPVRISATSPYWAETTTACKDMFTNTGTSRVGTNRDIYVGGNVDLWNSANAGIDPTYWDVSLKSEYVISGTATNGVVVGYGSYARGATCTLTFTPSAHYHFYTWYDGNTDNPRSFVVNKDKMINVEGFIDRHAISGTATHGSVSGYRTYDYGSTCVLTFTPDEHYTFVQWSDGNTNNPRAFTVTEDKVINVVGVPNKHTVTFSCVNGSVGATVDGIGIQSGAEVDYGKSVVFTITPNAHYHYLGVNPETVVVESDVVKSYVCEIDTHVVTTAVTPEGSGSVTGGGTYDYGAECTLTAVPLSGGSFVEWNDGNTDNPRVFNVSGDVTYTAEFALPPSVYYTVTASASNGSVSGSGLYEAGSTCTLTVTPNEGYEFEQWNDGNTDNPRSFVVDGDVTLVASCVLIPTSTALKFTSTGASTIQLKQNGDWSGTWPIETSTNGTTWSEYTLGTDISLANGEYVFFRGQKDSTAQSNANHRRFIMTGSVASSGDVTSLLNGIGGVSDLTPYGDYTLNRLFYSVSALTSAPSLPATTLASNCYRNMFYGCTSLVNAPTLPATSLVDYCYNNMFNGCSVLEGPVVISATSPYSSGTTSACANMFRSTGTSRVGTNRDIYVGGNVDLWNSANAGIYSTNWDVSLITEDA